MSAGKGFGGGEATRDPAPTVLDVNDPKGKQQAIHKVESFSEYLAKRAASSAAAPLPVAVAVAVAVCRPLDLLKDLTGGKVYYSASSPYYCSAEGAGGKDGGSGGGGIGGSPVTPFNGQPEPLSAQPYIRG